jgi:hypothetical protein
LTDLQREIEISEWLAKLVDTNKRIEKWGFGDLGRAGIFIAIRSLAEAERHNEEIENLLKEIKARLMLATVSYQVVSTP